MIRQLRDERIELVYHTIDNFIKGNGFHDRLLNKINKGFCLKNYDENVAFSNSDIFEFGGLLNLKFFFKYYFKGLRYFHFQDSRFRYHYSKFSFEHKSSDLFRLFYFFLIENLYSLFARIVFINKSDGDHILLRRNLIIDCPLNGIYEIRKKFIKEIRVFFVGNFSYEPNLRSLYTLSLYQLNFTLHIYGYNSDLIDKHLLNKRIVIHGEVPDWSIFNEDAVFFNFVSYGSGFKNKLTHCINFNIPLIGMSEAIIGSKVLVGVKFVRFTRLKDAVVFMNEFVAMKSCNYLIKLEI